MPLFSHDIEALAGTLKRMDEAKQRVEASGLPDADKQRKLETIEKNRENLLRHAEGLNNLLFERRQKGKQPTLQIPSGILPGPTPPPAGSIRALAGDGCSLQGERLTNRYERADRAVQEAEERQNRKATSCEGRLTVAINQLLRLLMARGQ
jgi:hypothetical protein